MNSILYHLIHIYLQGEKSLVLGSTSVLVPGPSDHCFLFLLLKFPIITRKNSELQLLVEIQRISDLFHHKTRFTTYSL